VDYQYYQWQLAANNLKNGLKPMQILMVDDHDLFREGLKFLLPALNESIEIREASSLAEAMGLSDNLEVDLILLDYYLPGVVGLEALQKFRKKFKSAMLVVISGEEDPGVIKAAIDQGASGYIPKTSSREDLEAALRLVLNGGTYLPESYLHESAAVNSGISRTNNGFVSPDAHLSRRQYEVLMKVVQGKPNKVIARELHISDQTVKTHLSQAYRILNVNNRTEAVYIAAKLGMRPENYPPPE
jgi:DNA-binding NarL/FixJ family response regulator